MEDIERHMPSWREEMRGGKMFGVLLYDGGYLKAYSGQINGRSDWEGYVPPVFDYLQEGGYFKTEEAAIVNINKEIETLERGDAYTTAKRLLDATKEEGEREVEEYRRIMHESKCRREVMRMAEDTDMEAIVREAQFQKAELRRIKKRVGERITEKQDAVNAIQDRITELKKHRRMRSDALQRWLFSHFLMMNGKGDSKDLLEIFAEWAVRNHSKCDVPPAGSGECCAPKLLQYAFKNNIKPIAVCEFWYQKEGVSLRHHGRFYPPCQSKCVPILSWMMQGMTVEERLAESENTASLHVLYEDEHIIVVDKPEGMLSVPGKKGQTSVYDVLQAMRPECERLMMVHRLDMQTSGILVAAKDIETYRRLQRLFADGKSAEDAQVRKTYVALLESVLHLPVGTKGVIELPLASDFDNRPMQRVDYEEGKRAVTIYEIIGEKDGHTVMKLTPVTGRTHQLRVHCAHPDGLSMPILGDNLYGHPADRLYLHASCLQLNDITIDSTVSFLNDEIS